MNKLERNKIMKLKERHDILLRRIKSLYSKQYEDLEEIEKRQLDQWYGECVGIEMALETLRIEFEKVD